MARPRKKQRLTYDSNEMKTILGLLFLFSGVLALLSLFLEGAIFSIYQDIFSNDLATLIFSLFQFDLALAQFKSKWPFSQKKSLWGQLLFLVAYSAFLNSIWGTNYKLVPGSPVQYGGLVGYHVFTFLSENLFLNFTPIFIMGLIFISIPLTFGLTIHQFLEKLGSIMEKIINLITRKRSEQQIETIPQSAGEEAQTFGDFQRRAELAVVGKAKDIIPEKERDNEPKDPGMHSDIGSKVPLVAIKEKKNEGALINSSLKYPNWMLPGMEIFNNFKKKKISQENISRNADTIEQTLKSFGIKAKVVDVLIGPSVTQYALDLALGIKVSKITNLANNLALALATQSIRLETPIPGTSYIGIEVPNFERETVYLKEAMQEIMSYSDKMLLPLAVGKDIHGKMIMIDLQKMPHMLIAGATGSGKSILTNGFIVSLLMTRTPDQVKFIMVDPKQVELSDYNGIPHLLTPVITEMDKVLNSLKWAIAEMETRYTLFREAKVKNIEGYNQMMGYSALPYIVIVIDEMADMMMSTNRVETEAAIVRLAQKARATGIHLLLATQRPSVDVITGLIKANIPGRVGMSVTTNIDSRVILDQIGAESLLGRGDMLFKDPAKQRPFRIQGIWVSPEEIQRMVRFVKEQVEEVEYHTEITQFAAKESAEVKDGDSINIADEEFANAVRVIVNAQKGSSSLLQRKLKIGYNKAARYIDEMEELGVVSEANGSKPRDVLVTDAEAFLNRINGKAEQVTEPVIEDIDEETPPQPENI